MQFLHIYKLKRFFNLIKMLTMLILILSCAWFVGQRIAGLHLKSQDMSGVLKKTVELTKIKNLNYSNIFSDSISLVNIPASGQDKAKEMINEDNLKSVFKSEMGIFARLDSESNSSYEIVADYDELEEEYIPELEGNFLPEEKPFIPEEPKKIFTSDKTIIGIYTTHNSESYIPSNGKDKLEGKNGGISKVAERLTTQLEKKGIKAARSTAIHDYPSFPLSYTESRKTAKALLEKNQSIQILIDVHRDAGAKTKTVAQVGDKKAAKILFIVGSNSRLKHPQWEKNKAFMEKINKKTNELYPNLSKGIRVQSGRYNQDLHPNAILIEVGNTHNTLEECYLTADLFAEVLAEVLKDMEK